MTFHLAGGEGGMRHMLKQFGPALKPWTKLIAPELTDDLYHKVVSGSEASSQDIQCLNLIKRNEFLIKVKELAEQYWPSDSKAMKSLTGGITMMNQQYVFHTKVHRDWVDHNGHLNDAMYNRIFSDTTDDWLGHLA